MFEERKTIMVIPAFAGAGTSFTAAALAGFLAKVERPESGFSAIGSALKNAKNEAGFSAAASALVKSARPSADYPAVSLIEPFDAYYFRAFGMEERFMDSSFVSFSEKLEKGESLKTVCNRKAGLNCLFRVPQRDEALTSAKLFRLAASAPGKYRVFDCSSMAEDIAEDFAAEADLRLLVIDPDPVRLIENCASVSRFLIRFPDTLIVVNKMNAGVHKGELKRFLGGRKTAELPFIAPELIYKMLYCCRMPGEIDEIAKLCAPAMEEIAAMLV